MAYFRQIPDFNYVSRTPNSQIGDYTRVKNLFRRVTIREDIFQDAAFFEKYQIKGDDRPDIVADEIYGDPELDWLVLIANNVINVQTEWPMSQLAFDEYLLDKYGSYENINAVHHYETIEIKNCQGVTLLPAGLQVDEGFSYSYYEEFTSAFVSTGDVTTPVTNYEYEERIEDAKRNIFILKPVYLPVVLDDIQDVMLYKKGSSDYISGTLKGSDNTRLTS